jgi:hypothetical protein
MYALVASAAGVATLALSQPGEAKIVYTKTHRVIGLGQHYHLDLNHDRIADFELINDFYAPTYYLKAHTLKRNVVAGKPYPLTAYALLAGAKIGPALPFGGSSMARSDPGGKSDWYGHWVNVRDRYLGLSFKIKGKTHYGWARLNVKLMPYDGFTATLTGYAYETIPNKPIIAGKTPDPDVTTVYAASLGHLAAGASAIPAWRVRQTEATTH